MLVAEDAGFWGHEGIDLAEIRKALETDWERGTSMRGASTITQQLAKNLYLSPTRNPFRKLSELLITRRLEHELSKTRIFELYLNNIEWGDGIWGAEAAARTYFGIPGVRDRARSGRDHGRRDRQSARAEHREAQRAPSGAPAHHPRAHGQHYAAAGCREAGAGRRAAPEPEPEYEPEEEPTPEPVRLAPAPEPEPEAEPGTRIRT